MPRRLPKSANEQFTQTLKEFEDKVHVFGAICNDPFAERNELERRIGTLRNKLIKMFETKGA